MDDKVQKSKSLKKSNLFWRIILKDHYWRQKDKLSHQWDFGKQKCYQLRGNSIGYIYFFFQFKSIKGWNQQNDSPDLISNSKTKKMLLAWSL